jgi:hypothetical protein
MDDDRTVMMLAGGVRFGDDDVGATMPSSSIFALAAAGRWYGMGVNLDHAAELLLPSRYSPPVASSSSRRSVSSSS